MNHHFDASCSNSRCDGSTNGAEQLTRFIVYQGSCLSAVEVLQESLLMRFEVDQTNVLLIYDTSAKVVGVSG